MIKVLLVDDHDLVRMGLAKLLAEMPDISVVGEAQSGEEALSLAKSLKPHVIMLDLNMPGMGGLEACKKLLRQDEHIKILVLTAQTEEPYPTLILQAGAAGFMTKGASVADMVQAIRTVAMGKRYLSPVIAQELALRRLSDEGKSPLELLSEREMQILLLITRGVKAPDIAEQLHLSPKTVNSYRYRMFEKLDVNSDVELTHLAIRHKLINN